MAEEMSKSAKRRAAKKARDAASAEPAAVEEPPAPAPKAKAKAKAQAAAPAPAEPKAKAKAAAKAPAQPEPKAAAKAAAEPKGKAKAKAKSAPAPAPAPEPEPAKPAAKAAGKAAAKPAAKSAGKAPKPAPVEEEPPAKKKEEPMSATIIDDGSGPAWEVSSGLSKKAQKRKEKKEEEVIIQQAVANQQKAQGYKPGATNFVPGMGPAGAGQAANTAIAAKDHGPEIQAKVAKALAAAAAAGQAAAAAEAAAGKDAPSGSIATIKVPEAKIGRVIGPKGGNIKLIQEKTGVTRIDTQGEVFTISGDPKAVASAEVAVRELIEKGYTSLAYDDFSENFVKVHPSSFPDLIGKGGCVVQAIKKETGCEVSFPDVPKNAAGTKTYKVTLAGSTSSVEKAKQIINDICMYYHHEVTHPGFIHEELDIDTWAHRYIIGKGGSEMKHIQHNWKVKVNIPREYSANQKVVVVGEKDQVDRAKAYIEKVIWNAENNSKGRDKVDNDGDMWGDEDADEPWMAQYLYKR